MGDPYTKEKCGICGKQFEIPMVMGNGWKRKDTAMVVEYYGDDGVDLYYDVVCLDCYNSVKNAVETTVSKLKSEAAK